MLISSSGSLVLHVLTPRRTIRQTDLLVNIAPFIFQNFNSNVSDVTLSVYPPPGRLKSLLDHGGNRTRFPKDMPVESVALGCTAA
jgi:hypothetical protein